MHPECQCSEPGYCERYKIIQDVLGLAVCQGKYGEEKRIRYCDKWTRNIGKEPSLATKAINASVALVKAVANGFRKTPLDVLESRKAICGACELNKDNVCHHQKCGCFLTSERILFGTVNRPGKLEVASESCPLGRFGPVKGE